MRKKELNYRVEGFSILLNENCILSRYYPLIPYKMIMIENLINMGYRTKSACTELKDSELLQIGIPDVTLIPLFRAFLNLYDINVDKMKEIEIISATDEEKTALRELFKLPGVRLTRAKLYYQSGYTNLYKIASALSEDVISATTATIDRNQLKCKPPLSKEVNTHIAVSNVFTRFAT